MSLAKSVVITSVLALFGPGMACIVAHADPAPPPPPAPKTTIDQDGVYAVGKDIVPGNYISPGPTANGACSWRRADSSDTTIDNSISKKSQVITIAPTDATFRTRGCQAWTPTDEAPPPPVGNLQAQLIVGALNGLSGGQGRSGAPAPAAPASPAPAASPGPAASASPSAAVPQAAPAPAPQAPAAPTLTAPTPAPAAPTG